MSLAKGKFLTLGLPSFVISNIDKRDDFKLTSGEQIRDFTNVSEIAKKILSEVKEFNVNAGETQIKNIGSNNPQSVKDFSEYWWDHWKAVGKLHFGAKPYRDDEVMRFVPDLTNSK